MCSCTARGGEWISRRQLNLTAELASQINSRRAHDSASGTNRNPVRVRLTPCLSVSSRLGQGLIVGTCPLDWLLELSRRLSPIFLRCECHTQHESRRKTVADEGARALLQGLLPRLLFYGKAAPHSFRTACVTAQIH